jgi:hypothetical protein
MTDVRRKQGFWETPRNIAILLAATAAIFSAAAGSVGYKIGSTPTAPPTIIINMPPIPPAAPTP